MKINLSQEIQEVMLENAKEMFYEKDMLLFLGILATNLERYPTLGCFRIDLNLPEEYINSYSPEVYGYGIGAGSKNVYGIDITKFVKLFRGEVFIELKNRYKHAVLNSKSKHKIKKSDFVTNIDYLITKEYAKDSSVPHFHCLFFFKGRVFNRRQSAISSNTIAIDLTKLVLKAWVEMLGLEREPETYEECTNPPSPKSYYKIETFNPYFWNYFKSIVVRGSYLLKDDGKVGMKGERFIFSSTPQYQFNERIIDECRKIFAFYSRVTNTWFLERKLSFKLGHVYFRFPRGKDESYAEPVRSNRRKELLMVELEVYDIEERVNTVTKRKPYGTLDALTWIDNEQAAYFYERVEYDTDEIDNYEEEDKPDKVTKRLESIIYGDICVKNKMYFDDEIFIVDYENHVKECENIKGGKYWKKIIGWGPLKVVNVEENLVIEEAHQLHNDV